MIKHAADDDAEPRSSRTSTGALRAPAGRDDHGPRRPRQDDAARRDSRDGGRRHRGGRDHAAHRRLPGRRRRTQDHVPRHAGPRGVHGDARSRREGDRHRDPRRRGRRRRDAPDAGVDLPRARRRGADRRRDQQDRRTDANIDRVKTELASEGLQPEDWGGTTQFAEVSAKQQTGLEELLESMLLVADAELDLRANAKADASGPIIESRLDVGRGAVATMLVQRGTLHVGDAIVAGDASGKVRALYDYRGEKVQEARPGEPVEILGFDRPPPAGELRARRRARAAGEGYRPEARRAASPRAARAALAGAASRSRPCLADAGGRCPGPQRRPQGRRAGSVEALLSERQIEISEVA